MSNGSLLAFVPAADAGLLALAIVARNHHLDIDTKAIAHELGLAGRKANSEDIVRAATIIGLKAGIATDRSIKELASAPRPAILRMKDGGYFVLDRLPNGQDTIRDPIGIKAHPVSAEEISQDWSGEILLFARRASAEEAKTDNKFGFSWFLESAKRYRKPLIHVLIASCFIQLFALVTPLFFQVVVDKVLVHNSTSTLEIVFVALVLIGLFDVVLQYLRSYALYHTASRIDVELGSQMYSRLFKLPLSYFETRPTGQTVARVREIETVRAFLTGQALTSIIDVLFTFIFITFLFTYSATLTFIVLGSIPVYILVAMLIRPVLRDKINEKFNRGAISQQFLVESVVGAPTLKAAAVEPIIQKQWEDRLAAYVRTAFQAVMIGSMGQGAIQYISKLTTACILLFGAKAVIAGELSVGELIAFNMISGQLTSPILRLSQLWQDVQQIQISVDRLGDILNATPEEHTGTIARMPRRALSGSIKFENVTFRYKPGGTEVLKNINLDIPLGQVIGIVGASGSGKSTLTKLVQRLYVPEEGKVLIDGHDIAHIHPGWFRTQIGVVLQENLLFNKTIHENIAITNPALPRDHVVRISQLSGADEFIRQLQFGYDTPVEERGANLSGGQRQRIAIARALARNPRILIFDEATSALDYESERIIQNNMREIVKGRTVIIVAHRLAAVRDCHRIISMSGGQIVEDGTHDELMAIPNGLYARLNELQGTRKTENTGMDMQDLTPTKISVRP